jgi:uncharacterized repeat protein (TIGR01451 family)
VTPTVAGTVTNTATVTGDNPDPNLTNNTSSTTTTVNQSSNSSDLSIVKTGTPNPVNVGSQLTYTLMVGNAGPSDDTNVTVSDTLPASMTFVSAMPSQGSCSGTTAISCNLGAVKNEAQATVTIVVTPTAQGMVTNTATVTGDNSDPNQTNNTSSTTTTVNSNSGNTFNFVPLPGTGTTATVVPGQGATFPLTIGSNNGFTGVVNLTCSISGPPSITCSILPSSVTLTNGITTTTISVKTFCSGAPPAGPSWRLPGVGLWYLAGAALFCGLAFAGRRRGLRLAWASGVLALALMCAGCPSTPKGPDGRTAPGTYHLTIFATAQGQQVPGGQIQLTLIVQ